MCAITVASGVLWFIRVVVVQSRKAGLWVAIVLLCVLLQTYLSSQILRLRQSNDLACFSPMVLVNRSSAVQRLSDESQLHLGQEWLIMLNSVPLLLGKYSVSLVAMFAWRKKTRRCTNYHSTRSQLMYSPHDRPGTCLVTCSLGPFSTLKTWSLKLAGALYSRCHSSRAHEALNIN